MSVAPRDHHVRPSCCGSRLQARLVSLPLAGKGFLKSSLPCSGHPETSAETIAVAPGNEFLHLGLLPLSSPSVHPAKPGHSIPFVAAHQSTRECRGPSLQRLWTRLHPRK